MVGQREARFTMLLDRRLRTIRSPIEVSRSPGRGLYN